MTKMIQILKATDSTMLAGNLQKLISQSFCNVNVLCNSTTKRMTKISFCALFLFCLLAGRSLHAQDISAQTLSWNAIKAVDQTNQSEIVYSSTFVTQAGASVQWLQNDGSKVYDYTIDTADGTWPDVSQDGSITYHVTGRKVTGDMVFSKSQGQWSVRVTIYFNGNITMDYLFSIDQVTTTN